MSEFIANHAVIISGLILFFAYVGIAIERIPKVTIALLGASITVSIGLLSHLKIVDDTLNPLYFANFVDFNVIFLLVSMMIIVNITARSGVFNFIANKLLMLTKGRPMAILAVLGIFTAVTSAFLDNVTTVILILPITFFIARKLEIDPVPFLLTEVFSSNIGGTATLIGDPPNIIIGSAAGFSFMDFVKVLTPVIAVILLSVIGALSLIFKDRLKADPAKMEEISKIDNTGVITDKALMIHSVTVLALVILGFVTHDITKIGACVVAMLGASVLLIFEKPSEIWHDVEWNTIFFFIGLFIIIGGVEASGGIKLMADYILNITHGSTEAASMLILWASGIISGIIDNIPYTATMVPMISEIQRNTGIAVTIPLWWSLSLGACLGGNLTMIGAAANVIVTETAHKEGYKISFLRFMKYGIYVVSFSLAVSSIYIYLVFLR